MSVTAYKYYRFPFAQSGTLATVPDTVQGDGSVSYPQGWGPDYALDPATQPAALDIPRDKSNQLMFDVTNTLKYYQEGKVPQWIAAADNGGVAFAYDFLALVLYTDGYLYQSVVAANNATPGASANWVRTRIRLGVNTTFYVDTSGSDSTGNGSIGNPWRTAQKASDTLQFKYDLNGFVATIQRTANLTWTDSVLVKGPYVGAIDHTSVVFLGNTGSANNTVTTVATCYTAQSGARFTVQGQKLVSSGNALLASNYGALIAYNDINFGSCGGGGNQIVADYNGQVSCGGNCTISASCAAHVVLSLSAIWVCNAVTYTLTGTPAWSVGFVTCQQNSTVNSQGVTFSGAATGSRYQGTLNGVIQTSGGGANYFPGNSAGSTASGAQYA